MTLAVFDINDSAIGHGTSPDDWRESPGYALLQGDSVVTGEAARKSAWLEPQRSYQQYWRQLNLAPLSHHNRAARHHADLAYAQLQQIHRDSGEPQEVVLAVPGSFDRDQLALLLGLVKASSFQAIGLVDSAVAAASQALDGSGLHLDIELHQCVITQLQGNGEVQRISAEPLHELGLKTMMDSWAHFIADEFIHQYRYDPLHTAAGEQQLYDLLPTWLQALRTASQTTATLDTAKGNFHLQLLRQELLAATQDRLQRLADAVRKLQRGNPIIYLSHRMARLPGLKELLPNAQVLSEQAVLNGCLAHIDQIRSDSSSLSFVTRLVTDSTATRQVARVVKSTPSLPTHALYGHRAVAIGQQVNFKRGDNGLEPCRNPQQADLSLLRNGSGLKVRVRDGLACEAPDRLETGSLIRLEDQEIRLIEIAES